MSSGAPIDLDEDLLSCAASGGLPLVRVWEPRFVAVVLGRGNVAEREVRLEACRSDGVPVVVRKGGGGAVVLGPGCLVVSVAGEAGNGFDVKTPMDAAVGLLRQSALAAFGVRLEPRGTGDLCFGERKVLGSSLFRRRSLFFYQASLLVRAELELLDRYLAHPSREPAYRAGRGHRDFVMNLADVLPGRDVAGLAAGLRAELEDRIRDQRWE